MKKILCIIAACFLVAAVSTSCNKKCTCKTYAAGVVIATEEDVELDRDTYNSCTDLNTYSETFNTGVKCESSMNIFD